MQLQKIRALFCLLSIVFSWNLFAEKMQNTGNEAPRGFHFFLFPIESLSLASNYLPENPVIIGSGAFEGDESKEMAKFWPNATIFAFEPIKEVYHKLVRNTEKFFNIHTYNYALGSKNEQKKMFLSCEPSDPKTVSMSSSLLEPKEHLSYSSTLFSGEEEVKVTTIDAWAEMNNIENVDLLWLDMQGFELEVLKASPKMLSKVSVIITELEFVEAYKDQPLFHEVKEWLEEQGFTLIGGNFTYPKSPSQWFGDGLFVRNELL